MPLYQVSNKEKYHKEIIRHTAESALQTAETLAKYSRTPITFEIHTEHGILIATCERTVNGEIIVTENH